MDPIDVGQEFRLFVDYAHTPDGLANALEALRPTTKGRILLVMGCSGDRDRKKRPVMAEIGTTLADLLVITTSDPCSEDPEAIVAEMEPGAAPGRYVVEMDRRAAIALVVRQAEPGDTVLIAGRGPETELDFGERRVPFDDRVVAAEELGRRGAGL